MIHVQFKLLMLFLCIWSLNIHHKIDFLLAQPLCKIQNSRKNNNSLIYSCRTNETIIIFDVVYNKLKVDREFRNDQLLSWQYILAMVAVPFYNVLTKRKRCCKWLHSYWLIYGNWIHYMFLSTKSTIKWTLWLYNKIGSKKSIMRKVLFSLDIR